jgi:hypothetical protein
MDEYREEGRGFYRYWMGTKSTKLQTLLSLTRL